MKRIATLARIAVGAPLIVVMVAKMAWEISQLPAHERKMLVDALLSMGDA